MERVSTLLAHSSVKITERHYAPWVQSRQAQLEADLERFWRKDPLVQAEIMRSTRRFRICPCEWQRRIRDTKTARPLAN
jgi:hypothetical protein